MDLLPPDVAAIKTVTFANWQESLNRLAVALGADHIARTSSGHDIYLYSPALVTDAIAEVVQDARAKGD